MLDETKLAFTSLVHWRTMSRSPDGNVLNITRQVATAATARQLDAWGIRIAQCRDVQVAIAIDLHSRKEHAPHIATGCYVKQVADAERHHTALLE